MLATSPIPKDLSAQYSPDTPAFRDDLHRNAAERLAFIPSPEERKGNSLCFRLLQLYRDNEGLLLLGAAQFFGSCMNMSAQILTRLDPPMPPTEILVVRQSITWILIVFYMWHRDIPYPVLGPPDVRFLLVLRGTSGFCGVFGMYYAVQYLSLSDATVLTFLSPFFTSFAGTWFLGEPISRRNLFAGLCSMAGVILIARPEALFGPSAPGTGGSNSAERGTPHQRITAVVISMVGVFGASGAFTSLRAIGTRAHTLHSMAYFSLFSGLISCILMIIGRTKPVISTGTEWAMLLVLVTLFGFAAQTLLIMGFQRETASRGSLAVYIQIVFASVLERIFFHATPSFLSVLGTVIILSSALYVVLTKQKDAGDQSVERHSGDVLEDNLGHRGFSGIDIAEGTAFSQDHGVNATEGDEAIEEGFACRLHTGR